MVWNAVRGVECFLLFFMHAADVGPAWRYGLTVAVSVRLSRDVYRMLPRGVMG